jgi:small conductance mechanosensitive channel
VLDATGWFVDPEVRVEDGVVFLNGRTETAELRRWAGDLARNTQDVAAVANRIELIEPSAWDFATARGGLRELWRDIVRSLPLVLFGLVTLGLSALAGWLVSRLARVMLRPRVRAKLLRGVLAALAGTLVFLVGTYIVLRVSGLTQLALTLVGGTGLIGLAVGIAFRDITENFLASIILSVERPFEPRDMIEVAGHMGFVQQLNVRTTVLMTLDGNLVQIPNATVYKGMLTNYTANPNRRDSLVVGIGYDDAIDEAQEVARKVLADHPAVLADPEPMVLAESLGKSTVDLRIYYWIDGREHSWIKVRSSVIRLVKRAFQAHGISMPDEAREVVFPRGVPVTLEERDGAARRGEPSASPAPARPERAVDPGSAGEEAVSTRAEGGLRSEADKIEEQARHGKPLDEDENLLVADGGAKPASGKPG